MRIRALVSGGLATLVLIAGCSSTSHPIELSARPAFDKRDVLEFRYHGSKVALRSVMFSADSVTGVDWRYPTDPRKAYATSEMSQPRVHRTTDAGSDGAGVLAIVGLGLLGAWLLLKAAIGSDP